MYDQQAEPYFVFGNINIAGFYGWRHPGDTTSAIDVALYTDLQGVCTTFLTLGKGYRVWRRTRVIDRRKKT
jgi:hypothetical protein